MVRFKALALLTALSALLLTLHAQALPGFYVAKNKEKVAADTGHVVILEKNGLTAVTIALDYEGPLAPFAWVLPVPSDVTTERIKTLKMEYVDRVEKLTAPRFQEFWETDPCDPEKVQQEWERSLVASEGTNFLGTTDPLGGPTTKVAKELFIKVDPDFKDGEYSYTLLSGDDAKTAADVLKKKGYQLSAEAEKALGPYIAAGNNVLIAEVDPKRIELIGGNRAQLSPVRFYTEKPYTKLPARLGLLSSPGKQELLVYVFHPDKRVETKNYPNVFPPTNLKVDFIVKEKMGEFYTALHDLMQQKNPLAFVNEFAWPSEGCGQPCQNEALLPHELMSLGGDVVEGPVPDEEKNPEPPEMTEEEEKVFEAKLKEMKPGDRPQAKKDNEKERKEVARRKALIARQKYMVTRLHHRYDASNLPKDPEIGPAAQQMEGGAFIPKGEEAAISTEVKPARESRMQTRYLFFHPWKGMMKCEKPARWRWGKPPRTYRGLRKIWIAEDLAERDRKRIKPSEVVQTAVPALGLSGVTPVDGGVAEAGAEGGEQKKGGCGCRTPGGSPAAPASAALVLAVFAGLWLRRRR
jgi:MYXO-CTERM domain-containing protein